MRFYIFISLTFFALCANAQLVNNGATIVVQPGSILEVQGNIQNFSGTITNNGEIRLTGDFVNNDQFVSGVNTKVVFHGSSDQNLESNGAVMEIVELDNSGSDVILTDNLTLKNELRFTGDNAQILIGPNNLILQTAAITTGADENNFIVTNGLGVVTKESLASFTFPVGYSETSYNPATLIENGVTDDKSIRVYQDAYEDGTISGTVINSKVVQASWEISESVSGGSDLDLDLNWQSGDETFDFDNSNCAIGRYDVGAYDGLLADLGSATGSGPFQRSRTGIDQMGVFIVGTNPALDFVSISPRIFLEGPFNGTDMNDGLRTHAVIPISEPYTAFSDFTHVALGGSESVAIDSDFDQTGTDDDIVDWVFLELRDDTDNTLVLGTQSALLQRDGDIVDTDMNPIKFSGFAEDDYNLVIRHRNHLGVCTNTAQSLSRSATSLDFTDGTTPAWGTNAMKLTSGTYTLWPGDINGDGNVFDNATPSDVTEVANAVLANPNNTGFFGSGPVSTFTGFTMAYERSDVNMDATVLDNATPSDGTVIANAVLSHPLNTGFFGSGPVSTFLNLIAQIPN